jgi:hypothetical protein
MQGMNNVKIMTAYFPECHSGGVDLATKHNQSKFQLL